jgi:hypothetical protein
LVKPLYITLYIIANILHKKSKYYNKDNKKPLTEADYHMSRRSSKSSVLSSFFSALSRNMIELTINSVWDCFCQSFSHVRVCTRPSTYTLDALWMYWNISAIFHQATQLWYSVKLCFWSPFFHSWFVATQNVATLLEETSLISGSLVRLPMIWSLLREFIVKVYYLNEHFVCHARGDSQ